MMKPRTLRVATYLTLLTQVAAGNPGAPAIFPAQDVHRFREGYRIAYYLAVAAELQKLEPNQRAKQLRALADDAQRGSEVFPLCRMLFEAKQNHKFRPPLIGEAFFVGGLTSKTCPLEPIVLREGVPILVVTDYALYGTPELPRQYVDYCLQQCTWRNVKYERLPPGVIKQTVDAFIASDPTLAKDSEWLVEQAG